MQAGSGIAGNPGRGVMRCDGGYVALAPRTQMNFSDMRMPCDSRKAPCSRLANAFAVGEKKP